MTTPLDTKAARAICEAAGAEPHVWNVDHMAERHFDFASAAWTELPEAIDEVERLRVLLRQACDEAARLHSIPERDQEDGDFECITRIRKEAGL